MWTTGSGRVFSQLHTGLKQFVSEVEAAEEEQEL